jgi:hypothetical protein
VILSLAARCRSEVERKVWMRARAAGSMERAAASILALTAGEGGDHRAADFAGDGADGFGVALGGDGEAGFEDVDAERGDLVGHAQLFSVVHGASGRLFAVAESGVEDVYAVGLGGDRGLFRVHGTRPHVFRFRITQAYSVLEGYHYF